MAETGGTGGLSGMALGGAAATAVVVVGGVTMAWLGLLGDGESDRVTRQDGVTQDGASSVAISPSAPVPTVVVGTSQSPDPIVSPDPVQDASPAETDAAASVDAPPVEQAAEQPAGTLTAQTEGDTLEQAQSVPSATSAQTTESGTAEPVAGNEAATDQAAQTDEGALFDAPMLDLVRVSPSGETVIAGRATEGVVLEILLDGTVLEQVAVGPGGDFVAFADLPPSRQPRVISLRASAEGQMRLSDSSFIVAPANSEPADAPADPVVATADKPASEVDLASADPAAEQSEQHRPPAALSAASEAVETTALETPAVAAEVPTASLEAGTDTATDTSVGTQLAQAPATIASNAPETQQAPADVVAPPEAQALTQTQVQSGAVDTAAMSQPGATTSEPVEDSATAETTSAPQPAPAQVAVLRADAQGVTLVQPIAPKPQGKVVLDTISYSASGEVQLAGRAGAASTVLVYLDNAPAGQFTAAETGSWGGALEAITPGVYTLRLDEVDETGKVLSRLETPFKREAPEVLLPPSSEGATGEAAPLVRAVTVQEGDTLWAISQQRYGSGFLYVRVFEANQKAIRDPDLIYPGQVFALPE